MRRTHTVGTPWRHDWGIRNITTTSEYSPLSRSDELTVAAGGAADRLPAWIEECGLLVVDGQVLTQTRSLGDRAAAALTLSGSPMGLSEFPEYVLDGRSTRSLMNAMAADARIVRVDRER